MRFLINGDGTVTDGTTGLMWVSDLVLLYDEFWRGFDNHKCDFTFAEADEFCRRLNFAGFNDWRMPSREELFLISDPNRSSPAIDADAFPRTGCQDYWTSTEQVINPNMAFVIGFYEGTVRLMRKNERALLRPVRVVSFKPVNPGAKE